MQIFFIKSEESKGVKGLGIIKKTIKKFNLKKSNISTFIGWSKVLGNYKNSLLNNIPNKNFYFVHSFYVNFFKRKDFKILYSLNGNTKFCSYINYKSLFLLQFHPEKSGIKGIEIYKKFKKKIEEN